MTTSNYRPTVVDEFYREHKALMEEAAQLEGDALRKQAATTTHAGNRKERRRKAAKARKETR